MRGIELSRLYFEEYGRPMLRHIAGFRGAAGLAGEGSECFGFDDEISRDHDFGPGFCIFVPDDTDEKFLQALQREYENLPHSFLGFERPMGEPSGGRRRGVIITGDFFEKLTGLRRPPLDLLEWFTIPEHGLAAATNGEVFYDSDGGFSARRRAFLDMPDDVRKKKIASRLVLMAQSGQYNFYRSISRGEWGAAALARAEFARHALSAVFLLNFRFAPFYKWAFRAARELPLLSFVAEKLERLLILELAQKSAERLCAIIENISADIATELKAQGLSDLEHNELEAHAYAVNSKISDPTVRGLHIMAAAD